MRRLLLVLAAGLILGGCSGSRVFGVTTTSDGHVEVLSVCDDAGIADVRVFSVGGDNELLVHLRPVAPRDDLPARVTVTASSPTHEALVISGLPLSGTVRVSAHYPLAATFTDDVVVDLDELRPGMVATATFDGTVSETRIETLDAFASSRGSCMGWDVPLPVTLGFFTVLAAGALTALVAIVRFVRKPAASPAPRSSLPQPPSPPRR